MKQMGIDVTELDAEEVIIKTAETELRFSDPQVTRMDAQGQETYQIIGEPTETDRTELESSSEPESASASQADSSTEGIPQEDVALVAERASVTQEDAREALNTTDGDLAAAIAELE
jgi:Nascent polypeptide associated complex NAC